MKFLIILLLSAACCMTVSAAADQEAEDAYESGYRTFYVPRMIGRFGFGYDRRTEFANSLRFPVIVPDSYETVGQGYFRRTQFS